MSTLDNLVFTLKECINLVDKIRTETKKEYDSEGFLLWNINDKLFILIKSQLQHLIAMLQSHELDIR